MPNDKPTEICRIIWEAIAGKSATLQIVQDAAIYNLIFCEQKSRSLVGQFRTLDVAMREAGIIIEGIDSDTITH